MAQHKVWSQQECSVSVFYHTAEFDEFGSFITTNNVFKTALTIRLLHWCILVLWAHWLMMFISWGSWPFHKTFAWALGCFDCHTSMLALNRGLEYHNYTLYAAWLLSNKWQTEPSMAYPLSALQRCFEIYVRSSVIGKLFSVYIYDITALQGGDQSATQQASPQMLPIGSFSTGSWAALLVNNTAFCLPCQATGA